MTEIYPLMYAVTTSWTTSFRGPSEACRQAVHPYLSPAWTPNPTPYRDGATPGSHRWYPAVADRCRSAWSAEYPFDDIARRRLGRIAGVLFQPVDLPFELLDLLTQKTVFVPQLANYDILVIHVLWDNRLFSKAQTYSWIFLKKV